MRGKRFDLIASIIQVIIGLCGIVAYIVLLTSHSENMLKWTITAVLSVAFLVIGIMRIIGYFKNK